MRRFIQVLILMLMAPTAVHAGSGPTEDPTIKLRSLSDYMSNLYSQTKQAPLQFETWYNIRQLLLSDERENQDHQQNVINLFKYLHEHKINIVIDYRMTDIHQTTRVLSSPVVATQGPHQLHTLNVDTQYGILFDSQPSQSNQFAWRDSFFIPLDSAFNIAEYSFMIPASATLQQDLKKLKRYVLRSNKETPDFPVKRNSPSFLRIADELMTFEIPQHEKPAILYPSVKSQVGAKMSTRAAQIEKMLEKELRRKSKEREKRRFK